MRILVVEDDVELADVLRRGLEEQLYAVDVAHDGETARHLATTEEFDLILLDLMLPKVDGMGVCYAVRSAGKVTPIIMLTARDHTDDRIMGLDAGADDYIVKPFSMGELFARIRAVLRRMTDQPGEVLRVGELSLNPRDDFLLYGDRKIRFTPREFALMQLFMRHPNQIMSRTEILERIWDANYEGLGNVVDVYVNYLRNKLEERGEQRIIATVRGRGYMLKVPADEA